jgi:DNA mismatch repair protein MutS
MAHIGCFVPAKSAVIPLTDRIFTRVGASDNLIFDQSTFMVEMTEVATILLRASKDSLLVLDEVGRGTSTYDGLSIAWSVIEYLAKHIGAKTLFSTHYHELTELENELYGVKNYRVTVRELNGAIVFLRKIVRGGANRSFGIEVASLAGVPKEVTHRAKAILKTLEKKDLLGRKKIEIEEETAEDKREFTEVEEILADTDLNTLSPIQALMLLGDLKEKLNSEK